MAKQVPWETVIEVALDKGAKEQKPIFVDFWFDGCIGCKFMNTDTYSQDQVVDFLVEHFIPVRSQCFFEHSTAMMRRYQVKWTPTFAILDQDGREHHRVVGFLPPEEFMAQLQLGKAKLFYDQDRLDRAASELQLVIDRFPKTAAAEEAIFLMGVSGYKRTHQAGELKKAWEKLSRDYPQSEWTKRARPYSAL